jgi:hypothetical protein
MTTPRFPGTLRAKAFYDADGKPQLEIELEEMQRLEELLTKELGREPLIQDLFDYVYRAQQQ